MKKITLVIVSLFFSIVCINAQTAQFGATAGYNSLIAAVKFQGVSASDNVSGFYVGLFADIKTSEKFHIQPEIQYVNSRQDGESGNSLVIPISGKFYVNEELSLLFGPQLDFILEESEEVKTTGIGFFGGMSYDITKKVFLSARYSFGLNNRLEDEAVVFIDDDVDPGFDFSDITTKINFLQIGLGFRF